MLKVSYKKCHNYTRGRSGARREKLRAAHRARREGEKMKILGCRCAVKNWKLSQRLADTSKASRYLFLIYLRSFESAIERSLLCCTSNRFDQFPTSEKQRLERRQSSCLRSGGLETQFPDERKMCVSTPYARVLLLRRAGVLVEGKHGLSMIKSVMKRRKVAASLRQQFLTRRMMTSDAQLLLPRSDETRLA